jgi:hypothetical protein
MDECLSWRTDIKKRTMDVFHEGLQASFSLWPLGYWDAGIPWAAQSMAGQSWEWHIPQALHSGPALCVLLIVDDVAFPILRDNRSSIAPLPKRQKRKGKKKAKNVCWSQKESIFLDGDGMWSNSLGPILPEHAEGKLTRTGA